MEILCANPIQLSVNRWTKSKTKLKKAWDHRPFTRIVESWRKKLNLRDYTHINHIEGLGYSRLEARVIFEHEAQTWRGFD